MAQLGARFHGMEEVDGSNPSRSTNSFLALALQWAVPKSQIRTTSEPVRQFHCFGP